LLALLNSLTFFLPIALIPEGEFAQRRCESDLYGIVIILSIFGYKKTAGLGG
jgi:hypothetical protein